MNKRKMLSKMSTCILVLVILLASLCLAVLGINLGIGAVVAETTKTSIIKDSETILASKSIDESMQVIEENLLSNNTSVVSELNKQVAYYEYMRNINSDEDKILQINNLIATTKDLISDYNTYQNPSARGKFNILYSAQVATLIAWFNGCKYKLSAELLTHARDNNIIDSYYSPVEKSIIYSSATFKNISNGSATTGDSEFKNEGSIEDQDLYYAIHAFSFSKSKSGTKVVTIMDRYDYAKDNGYPGAADLAVNAMVDAQNYGTIVPFKMDLTFTPTTSLDVDSHSLQYVSLGPGEKAVFSMRFMSTKLPVTIETQLGSGNIHIVAYEFTINPMALYKVVAEDKGVEGRNSKIVFKPSSIMTFYRVEMSFNNDTGGSLILKIST